MATTCARESRSWKNGNPRKRSNEKLCRRAAAAAAPPPPSSSSSSSSTTTTTTTTASFAHRGFVPAMRFLVPLSAQKSVLPDVHGLAAASSGSDVTAASCQPSLIQRRTRLSLPEANQSPLLELNFILPLAPEPTRFRTRAVFFFFTSLPPPPLLPRACISLPPPSVRKSQSTLR